MLVIRWILRSGIHADDIVCNVLGGGRLVIPDNESPLAISVSLHAVSLHMSHLHLARSVEMLLGMQGKEIELVVQLVGRTADSVKEGI
jgi:hypothetical protein